jgi:hypothetical protein
MKDSWEGMGIKKKCLSEAKEKRRIYHMVIKLEQAFANELQLVIRIFYLEESL